jgi:hypothetical protein
VRMPWRRRGGDGARACAALVSSYATPSSRLTSFCVTTADSAEQLSLLPCAWPAGSTNVFSQTGCNAATVCWIERALASCRSPAVWSARTRAMGAQEVMPTCANSQIFLSTDRSYRTLKLARQYICRRVCRVALTGSLSSLTIYVLDGWVFMQRRKVKSFNTRR